MLILAKTQNDLVNKYKDICYICKVDNGEKCLIHSVNIHDVYTFIIAVALFTNMDEL